MAYQTKADMEAALVKVEEGKKALSDEVVRLTAKLAAIRAILES